MRKILTLLAILAFGIAYAQKNPKKFTLPQGISKSDIYPGMALVKLKSTEKSNFLRSGVGARSTKSFSSKPLVNPQAATAARSNAGPYRQQKSGLDMSLYYELHFSKSENIENVIQDLYATGLFELVEPVYRNKMDFIPDDPSITQQYYLDLINAYEAWDITQGDTETVIAIVDSGGDLDHPDLVNQLYTNPDEVASDGLDNDADGYIDNVRGWDFAGDDTLNTFDSDFIGDNDTQLFNGGTLGHGVNVAGCASASTNNNVGIAGIGFKTKILHTKHTADNQNEEDPGLSNAYAGILFAATSLTQDNVPRKIINCSWGGPGRSQIAQDIITYVTFDLGCLVIGAAGNSNSKNAHYPSGYDYVLSVAATTATDGKASFTNYGSTVDISAPGTGIFTTSFDDIYTTTQGTSFSCPITSGAAALVWSHNPSFTPLQVAEQLRISADPIIYTKISSTFKNLMGKGRLDVASALTLESPSIRATNVRLVNAQGIFVEPGQSGFLNITFTNYLKSSTNGLKVKATSSSSDIAFQNDEIALGLIDEGQSVEKFFPVTLAANVTENKVIDVTLTFTDGNFSDFQIISFLINPSYVDVDENKITTSITSRGRVGYDDPNNQEKGSGFIFNDASILFEMGLIMGTSSTDINNNVRGINSSFDQDFTFIDRIRKAIPGERSTSEVYGSFANASTLPSASLQVTYRSLVWNEAPYDQFVILEYKVKNVSVNTLNNFHFGVFADWDISTNGQLDAAGWNSSKKIGFIYPKNLPELPHAGIQVLNQAARYYAIDNDQSISGNPFGLYDGYTDPEKFTSLSTERLIAGESTAEGNDVSHVVSSGPFTINSGDEITIAFALHAANNLEELLTSAAEADTAYNFLLQAPKPTVVDAETCYGSNASISASGASNLNWYTEFTGGSPIYSGATLVTGNLYNDTIFYVSNAEQSYESVRTAANVLVKAIPTITSSVATPIVCGTDSITLSVATADEYLWSNGATTQSIDVSAGTFDVTVVDNTLLCESTSPEITISSIPKPTALFTASTLSAINGDPIDFTDASTDAVLWSWNFGDNQTSTLQNPTHTYQTGGSFDVTLIVSGDNGCQDEHTVTLDIILSAEETINNLIKVFPNPTNSEVLTIEFENSLAVRSISLTNVQGKILFNKEFESHNSPSEKINFSELSGGIYLLRISTNYGMVTRKIIRTK
ncbi:MAG: S8 family serine peptidase [Flammeovirgaceae bacterium]|nr:S8 family serine peptidase [Flammeovirgaceae bacterium]